MAVLFAPALVTRVEHVGGDFQRRSHGAFLLNELRRQVVGLLELCGGRNDALREIEAAALAEPRQPLERTIKDAATLGLDPLFYLWVALSLEGRELHDLDAPKDARRGVSKNAIGTFLNRSHDRSASRAWSASGSFSISGRIRYLKSRRRLISPLLDHGLPKPRLPVLLAIPRLGALGQVHAIAVPDPGYGLR